MQRPGDLALLVPVDISERDTPDLRILDYFGPIQVVLLGYFPVPDQAEPALLRDEHGDEAAARLHALADHPVEIEEVLVFTHDRGATIDRVADEHDCDAVLTVGAVDELDRVLVPVRGEVNLERIIAVVAGLLRANEATVTFYHAAVEDADPTHGELLLRGTVDRLSEYGIDEERIERELSTTDDPVAEIVRLGAGYDLVVFGETEPTLTERIMGDTLSRMVDGIDRSALVVRNTE